MADAVPIVLAKWGMNMVEATVVEWKRSVGDPVVEGEAIATIATDKVEADVVAPATGILVEILVLPDQDAGVGDTLGYIRPEEAR